MSDDIRSKLISQSKPKVAPRSHSLKRKSSPVQEEIIEAENQFSPELDELGSESTSQLQQLQEELERLPTVGKRLAVHLEQRIRADLVKLCDEQEITPEIFIEAAYACLQQQPELLDSIIAEAKVRLKQRKQAGVLRRTLAMVQKYQ